jgi:hypothetical protein
MDKTVLQSYIPIEAVDTICAILAPYPLKLKIVNPRKRIHGSYRRPKFDTDYHLITINRDLNPYMFLIILLHEIAHMQTWLYRRLMKHGYMWRCYFKALLEQFLSLNVFPDDIHYALENHLQNITSSLYLDVYLSKILQKYDDKPFVDQNLMALEDVPKNTVFLYGNKKMEKQAFLRKYYLCKDLKTNRMYRCHPLMKVSLI